MTDLEIFQSRINYINQFKRTEINTTYEDAKFLRVIVQSINAKNGIEIGSANGFGAIHMGMGFEHTGGHLHTIEIDPRMVKQCRQNIKEAGLEKTITCIFGDALKVLPNMEGKYDFVFIDAHKPDYYKYFKAIEPKLKPGAVIVADNVIRAANLMRDFLDAVEKDPNYDMVTFRASDQKRVGMAVIYKIK